MKDFRKLKIWHHGIDVVADVYRFSQEFPKKEVYSLTSQMRCAVVSVPSNIAEGSGRNSDTNFGRFLDISLGSAFELETQLIIANKLEFLSNEKFCELVKKSSGRTKNDLRSSTKFEN